ncbi:MAG: site-2 protease family protein [Clostridium chrysemydis]|uniref:site-2 protease family protein n=1 Tax=Clostridium chrysemydis TaxID=2665504 RepID=UPI003F3DB40F
MKKSIKFLLLDIVILAIVINFNNLYLLGFLFIFLHEFTHVFVSKLYGLNLYKIDFLLIGTKAEIEEIEDLDSFKRFIIYFSGPFLNLILGLIFYIISLKVNWSFLNICYSLNLGLFFFNILPCYPLDGSRMLEIIIMRFMTFRKGKKVVSIVSLVISVIFIISFFILLILHKINITLLLVGGLFIYSAITERKATSYIMMSDLIKKRKRIENEGYIQNRTLSVYYKMSLLKVLMLFEKDKFNTFYILDEEIKLLKIIHEDEVIKGLKEYGDISLEEYIKKEDV